MATTRLDRVPEYARDALLAAVQLYNEQAARGTGILVTHEVVVNNMPWLTWTDDVWRSAGEKFASTSCLVYDAMKEPLRDILVNQMSEYLRHMPENAPNVVNKLKPDAGTRTMDATSAPNAGGFAANNNPSSFHHAVNILVTAMTSCFTSVLSPFILKAAIDGRVDGYNGYSYSYDGENNMHFALHGYPLHIKTWIDRMLGRTVANKVGRESTHRDEATPEMAATKRRAPSAPPVPVRKKKTTTKKLKAKTKKRDRDEDEAKMKPGDEDEAKMKPGDEDEAKKESETSLSYAAKAGGWVQLQGMSSFRCVPGSGKAVTLGNGFNKMSKEEIKTYTASVRAVEVPPGCGVMFLETIVHEVAPTKRAGFLDIMLRVFTGFEWDASHTACTPSASDEEMADGAALHLKSGQLFGPIPGSYYNFHPDKVVAWAHKFVPAARRTMTRKNGDEIIAPLWWWPSMKEMGLIVPDYKKYPAYTRILRGHEIVGCMHTDESAGDARPSPAKKQRL